MYDGQNISIPYRRFLFYEAFFPGEEGTDTNIPLVKLASFNFYSSEQRPGILRHPNSEYRFDFVSRS